MPVRSFFVLGFDILMVADSRLVWVIVLPCISMLSQRGYLLAGIMLYQKEERLALLGRQYHHRRPYI